jgi:hypothetical protein
MSWSNWMFNDAIVVKPAKVKQPDAPHRQVGQFRQPFQRGAGSLSGRFLAPAKSEAAKIDNSFKTPFPPRVFTIFHRVFHIFALFFCDFPPTFWDFYDKIGRPFLSLIKSW